MATDNRAALDSLAYELAHRFLVGVVQRRLPGAMFNPKTRDFLTAGQFVDGYLRAEWENRPTTLTGNHGVYKELLEAAQNKQGMPNTINRLLRDGQVNPGVPQEIWENPNDLIGRLFVVTYGFDPLEVCSSYPCDNARLDESADRLLNEIINQLRPKSVPRRKRGSQWPSCCKSIITGAHFLRQFSDFTDFDNFITLRSRTVDARIECAWRIARDIHGVGFALACVFLKDCVYLDYSKPDLQLKDLCEGLALSGSISDEEVFRAIDRVALINGVKPFGVDKLLWLIGTGRFHHHNEAIGDQKPAFLNFARENGYPVVLRRPR